MVRGLGDRHGRIAHRRHQALDGLGMGEKVGVEHQDEVTVGLAECVIDVAGFRALVVRACDPAHAQLLAQLAEPGSASVVEHIHRRLSFPLQTCRGEDGALEDLRALVDRRNEHVHARILEMGEHVPRPASSPIGLPCAARPEEGEREKKLGDPGDFHEGDDLHVNALRIEPSPRHRLSQAPVKIASDQDSDGEQRRAPPPHGTVVSQP